MGTGNTQAPEERGTILWGICHGGTSKVAGHMGGWRGIAMPGARGKGRANARGSEKEAKRSGIAKQAVKPKARVRGLRVQTPQAPGPRMGPAGAQ